MTGFPFEKLTQAILGVAPRGIVRQYGLEIVAAVCAATAIGVLLYVAYIAMAAELGEQLARLAIVAALSLAALIAHQAASRRRRRSEAEALRSRAELENLLGVAQGLMGRKAAPLAAFAAAFVAGRRI